MNALHERARTALVAALAACFLAGASIAMGEDKLYKWVDEDGNVTYQDQPPPDDSGQLETLSEDLGGSDSAAVPPDVSVVLYSIEVCDACDLVRKVLEDHGVPFEEKNADDNAEIQAEIREVAGTLSVPVLVIGGEVLTGYNKQMILSELEQAGFTGQTAEDGQPGQSRQVTREELEQMTPEERQQAAEEAALRGEDNDLFDEDEGFLLEEDIFSDDESGGGSGRGGDDISDLEEIPEDERIKINQ